MQRTTAHPTTEPDDTASDLCEQGRDLIRDVLERIGDKWSVVVICRLSDTTRRFNELRRMSEPITQRMLSAPLRALERDGLVTRTVHDTKPPRVDYALGRAASVCSRSSAVWRMGGGQRRRHPGLAEGARAVFSVQMPAMRDGDLDYEGELAQAVNLIEGALAANVPQFVHTAVSGAGRHTEAPGWAEGRWASMERGLSAKAGAQDRVREAGFTHWSIINPGFFMENFLPSVAYLFPQGVEGGLATVLRPGTRLSLVAVRDIGTAAAAVAARMPGMGASSHEFVDVVGRPARPEYARAFGIPLTTFEEWAYEHLRPAA
jgi:DNA-binding HxlR family transcriptional regulator